MKSQLLKNKFTSGEVTPLIAARPDLPQYAEGVKEMNNCYSLVHGGVVAAPGTKYLNDLSTYTSGVTNGLERMIPFQFSDDLSLNIIMGNNTLSALQSSDDTLLVAPTTTMPYFNSQLSGVTYTQVDDKLYLAHPSHPPQVISIGFSPNSINIAPVVFETRALSGIGFVSNYASFTILQGTEPFTSGATVGTQFTFTTNGSGGFSTPILTQSVPAPANPANGEMINIVINPDTDLAGRVYVVTVVKTINPLAPTRQEWLITTSDNLDIVASWSPGNYPGAVGVYEQRLFWGGTALDPSTLWGSKSGKENHGTLVFGAENNDSIKIVIATGGYERIRHMEGVKSLLVFSDIKDYTLTGAGGFEMKPNSVLVKVNSSFGADGARPVTIDGDTVYVSQGRYIRATKTNAENSPELSIISEHLPRISPVIKMAYAKKPHSVLWMLRENGTLLAMVTSRDQNIVSFGVRSTINGFFTDLIVVRSPTVDQVYVIVRRFIEGQVRYYMEKMDYDSIVNGVPGATLDCSVTVTPPVPTSTIPNINHLEFEEVNSVYTVSGYSGHKVGGLTQIPGGGSVTLPEDATAATVGYPINPNMLMLNPEPLEAVTTRSGALNVFRLTVVLHETLGIKLEYFDAEGILHDEEDIVFAQFDDNFDRPLPLFTGQKSIDLSQGWETPHELRISQTRPMPWTVLALIQEVNFNGR